MMELLENLDKLHTTELGIIRIRKNLGLGDSVDVIAYCKDVISRPDTLIERKGKNFYATSAKEIITINASKLSIITAHQVKIR